MNNEILTSFEVIQNTSMDASYPTDVINTNITRIVKTAFLDCELGLDKYKSLLDDLTPIPENLWQDTTTYNTGDPIIYRGGYYRSKIDSNDTSPENQDLWEPLPKFITPENNQLWVEGRMRNWLCLLVWYGTLKYNQSKSAAKGNTKQESTQDGLTSISYQEYMELKKGIRSDADDEYRLMILYMKQERPKPTDESTYRKPRRFAGA